MDGFELNNVVMSEFAYGQSSTSFFAFTNLGLKKIGYKKDIDQDNHVAIDRMDVFKESLYDAFDYGILARHLDEFHSDGFFAGIKKKVDQFDDSFSMFDLIPTEFG